MSASHEESPVRDERINPGVTDIQSARAMPVLPAASAVSWAAILAGAAAAAAMSLILLILGTGFGLSAVSPWVQEGIGAETFTTGSILWVSFASLVSAGLGGYLAGRLRTRWLAVDPDEVYFRDTAHGFLTWAIATLATALLLTTVIAGIVGTGVQATAAVTAGGMVAAGSAAAVVAGMDNDSVVDDQQYFVDSLFRRDANADQLTAQSSQAAATALAETGRILDRALTRESLPEDDLRHAAQLIARHTGLTEQAAAQRMTDVVARIEGSLLSAETAARESADQARAAAAKAALWLFVALLAGAFVASLSATYGGRQRDLY